MSVSHPTRRPNFVVFCTDQQRADYLGCAGDPFLRTPAIDSLAARGIRFRNCYTTYNACMPARGAMLTGLTHRASGMRSNGVGLPTHIPTVPALLRQAGYRTHAVGKLHLQPWHDPKSIAIREWENAGQNPERLSFWEQGDICQGPRDYYGFETTELTIGHVSEMQGDYRVWLDRHYPGAVAAYRSDIASDPSKKTAAPSAWSIQAPPESHYNHWIADRSIAFLNEHKDNARPFFLWCSFPDPHEPFAALEAWANLYAPGSERKNQEPDALPETLLQARGGRDAFLARWKQVKEKLPEYLRQTRGMISHLDYQIGRVLAALRQSGLESNTTLLFLSDHGDELGDHGLLHKGYWPYDGNSRVPFIVAGASVQEPGRVVDDVVSLLDLAPTLLAAADVQQPDDPPVNAAYRRQMGQWLPSLPGESLLPVLQSAQARPGRRTALVETDDELNPHFDLLQMRVLVTNDYKLCHYSPTGEVVVFDRKNDPDERVNLADNPELQPLIRTLLAQLLVEINRTEARRPRRFSDA